LKVVIENTVCDFTFLGVFPERARLQTIELACDIISVYACPSAYFSGAVMFPLQTQFKTSPSLMNHWRRGRHPPADVRLITMEYVLDKIGIKNKSSHISALLKDIGYAIKIKNLTLDDSTWRFLEKYSDIMAQFTEEFYKKLTLEDFD